ncbi:MAG: Unknown protein [uncultured Sulfurovum sp.]|uniref:Uncharacterized protein n=1 Tax=uncultured Sulfurovum sp. TaxID=269237 RepID=A0A6S6U2S8_9BACT|nr:MAG: Unknown protein [uncultured Sulfurovum sp.]
MKVSSEFQDDLLSAHLKQTNKAQNSPQLTKKPKQ